jgi:hypothetical protein
MSCKPRTPAILVLLVAASCVAEQDGGVPPFDAQPAFWSGILGAGSAYTVLSGTEWSYNYHRSHGADDPPSSVTAGLPATALALWNQQNNTYAVLPERPALEAPAHPSVSYLFSGTALDCGRLFSTWDALPPPFNYSGIPVNPSSMGFMKGSIDGARADIQLPMKWDRPNHRVVRFDNLPLGWHNASIEFQNQWSVRLEHSGYRSMLMRLNG